MTFDVMAFTGNAAFDYCASVVAYFLVIAVTVRVLVQIFRQAGDR